MTDIPQSATHPSRRGFLGRAALVAAAPAAAAILGPTLIPTSAAQADAAPVDDLPTFAPVPPSSFRSGPKC
jgi:nitrous oxide reductase